MIIQNKCNVFQKPNKVTEYPQGKLASIYGVPSVNCKAPLRKPAHPVKGKLIDIKI